MRRLRRDDDLTDARLADAASFARSSSTDDMTALLGEAVAIVDPLLAAEVVGVWWEIEAGGPFRLAAGLGFTMLEPGRTVVDGVRSHPALVRERNAGSALGQPVVLVGGLGDPSAPEPVTGGIGVPVRSDGRIVGVVAGYSIDADHVGGDDLVFLQAMATSLGASADRIRFEEQIAYASLHDPLTGLPNRTMLLDDLTRCLRSADGPRVGVVAACGIDDVQLLTEALGSDVTDDLLRLVAVRLRAVATGAMVARTGGDMFALVVPMEVQEARSTTIAATIIASMSAPFDVGDGVVELTASVGVATGSAGDRASDVLGHALSALHRARSQGRGQWLHASGQEQAAAVHHLALIRSLRTAVEDGELCAHFQPIISLRQDRIVGYEALARWTRPDGTSVAPEEFIPLAEKTGIIVDLGLSILDQACAFIKAARVAAADDDLMVSVNVSPRQLDDLDLLARVDAVLARHDLPHRAVCLELTESALVPGDSAMVERLSALRRLGVSLAIDDFGTGYSSFAYLTQFPIDLLKLDRAFVTDLQSDSRRVAVARSIITLARALGISVLAEGIETTTERQVFTDLDCEMGQGYLWSRAVPADDAASLLRHSAFVDG